MRRLVIAFLTLTLASAARSLVVGYVTVDDRAASLATSLDFDKLTHLNLAFENPVNDLGELSHHPGNTGLLEAARVHGVKVLISIGGSGAGKRERKTRALQEGAVKGTIASRYFRGR